MKKILFAAIVLASFASCSKTEYTTPIDAVRPATTTTTLTTAWGTDESGDLANVWKIDISLNQEIPSGVAVTALVKWNDGLVNYSELFTVVTTSVTSGVTYTTKKRATSVTPDQIYYVSISAEGYIF